MAVERPAGKFLWVNNLTVSVLRLAGYDLNCCSAASTSSSSPSPSSPLLASFVSAITTAAHEIDHSTNTGADASPVAAGSMRQLPLPADLEPTRALLERYSGIPAGDVARHIYRIVRKLSAIYPEVDGLISCFLLVGMCIFYLSISSVFIISNRLFLYIPFPIVKSPPARDSTFHTFRSEPGQPEPSHPPPPPPRPKPH